MEAKRAVKIMSYLDRVALGSGPVSIQAGITDFCFNKCHMCNHHLRENKTQIEAKEWIGFLSNRNYAESVCYSGGDPLFHKDFNDIMKYHVDSSTAFGLITAGYIPPHIDLDLLAKARWVRVSLDSVDPTIYEKCRGGIKVDKILDSIDLAKKAGVNIELTITVSEYSKNDLYDLVDYAIMNKFNADIHPVYGSTFESLGIDRKIKMAVSLFSQHDLTLAPYSFGSSNFKKCYAPYYQIFIDAFGDIYPCCTMAGDTKEMPQTSRLGNISDWKDFIKQRHLFFQHFRKEGECKNCVGRFCEINEVIEQSLEITSKGNFF